MSRFNIQAPEGKLINYLDEISTLDWYRFKNKYISTDVNEMEDKQHINSPPFITFRFKNELKEFVDKLKLLVNSYQGTIKWELYEHKRDGLFGSNWVIRPSRITEVISLAEKENLSPDQFIAKYEPEFTIIAFDDLNGLTKYIEENLHN